MENGNISQGEGKDPSSFLSDIIGNPVTVKLNSGVVYKGEIEPKSLLPNSMRARADAVVFLFPHDLHFTNLSSVGELQSVDGYMNIALEKTEEYVHGVKRREYGDAFVRGNNGESTAKMCYHCGIVEANGSQ